MEPVVIAKLSTEAPKCKVCGERHWLAEGHQYGDGAAIMVSPEQGGPVTKRNPQPLNKDWGSSFSVKPVTKVGRGRPKRYENNAARQKAYRERHATRS